MGYLDDEEWLDLLRSSFKGAALVSDGASEGLHRLVWFVFRVGPLRVAYPRFPVGLEADDLANVEELRWHLTQLRNGGVDVAQISLPESSGVQLTVGHHSVDLPDTTIQDLQSWSEAALTQSCRTKVRRAARAGLIVDGARPEEGRVVWRLYQQTITRHGGAARYPQKYFERLVELAAAGGCLRVGVARSPIHGAVGFIATAVNGSRAYYLHGGFDDAAARLRPGYLCLEWAIREAIAARCTEFRMLTSPARQTALVRYKESFGGTTQLRRHFSVPSSYFVGRIAACALAWNARRRQLR